MLLVVFVSLQIQKVFKIEHSERKSVQNRTFFNMYKHIKLLIITILCFVACSLEREYTSKDV